MSVLAETRSDVALILDTAHRLLVEGSPVSTAMARDLFTLAVEVTIDAAGELAVDELRARWLDAADVMSKLADALARP